MIFAVSRGARARTRMTLALVAVIAVAPLWASSATAAELNTPPLHSNSSSAVFYSCTVTNLGSKAITDAELTLVRAGGVASLISTISVPPGDTVTLTLGGGLSVYARCQLKGKFSKGKTLFTIQILDGAGGSRAALSAQ